MDGVFDVLGLQFIPGVTAGSIFIMALLSVLIWWVRGLPERTRAQTESDASLRTDLLKRISDLERDLADERRTCDERLREMNSKLDGVIRQFVNYQMAVARHLPEAPSPVIDQMLEDLGNVVACEPVMRPESGHE